MVLTSYQKSLLVGVVKTHGGNTNAVIVGFERAVGNLTGEQKAKALFIAETFKADLTNAPGETAVERETFAQRSFITAMESLLG